MFQGYLLLIFLAGGLLSVPATLLLIRRYRRRVIKLMSKSRGAAASMEPKVAVRGIPFQLNILTDPAQKSGDPFARQQYRRTVVSHTTGLAVFALSSAACLILSGGIAISLTRLAVIGLIYLMPMLLVLPLLTGLSGRRWTIAFLLLLAIYLSSGLLLSSEAAVWGLLQLFAGQSLVPAGVAAVLLHPRLRAGGILVLVICNLCLAGFFGLPAPLQNEEVSRAAVDFFSGQGIYYANDILLLISLLGASTGGIIAWWLLSRIKKRYLQKTISDRGLLIDGIVLYFAICLGLLSSAAGLQWLLWGLACFLLYKWTVNFLLRRWVYPKAEQHAGRSLLLLRVFALQERSDALFRHLSRYWRLQGPVHLIAGPDIVHSTIEPHEFMDFLTGRLSRQFLPDSKAVAQRIQSLDTEPSRDGYYSVNDLFCHDNTWRLALEQLAHHSDQILMDLRSFSEHRKGCIHEINALFKLVPVEQFRFVIDPTTDLPFLKAVIADACQQIPVGSPNDRVGDTLQVRAHWLEGERYKVLPLLAG